MFEGSDQLYQFMMIASRNSSASNQQLPLTNFHLHNCSTVSDLNTNNNSPLDLYNPNLSQLPIIPLQAPSALKINNGHGRHDDHHQKEENGSRLDVSMNLEANIHERQRSNIHHHPWSSDEVLALLRIRSGMENWFPDFTWEHVSGKLGEMGFKRSAEKCKERFEEESRYFNDNINFSKNCRLFSELEEQFYNVNDNSHVGAEKNRKMLMEKSPNEHERLEEDEEEEEEEEDKEGRESTNLEVLEDLRHDKVSDGKEVVEEVKMVEVSRSKKRKKKSLEMLMGFCEGVVKKMMEQQEEMHSKLLEDMVRRDEEKLAEEEAWRKQEVDRMNQELDIMANEQEIEGNRQAKIIEFFKQFASIPLETHEFFRGRNEKDPQKVIPENSKTFVQAQNPNPTCRDDDPIVTKTLDRQKPNSTKVAISSNQQNPNHSPKTKKNQSNPSQISTKKIPQSTNSNHEKAELLDSIGKRWPRDEVLALINLRCNTSNINNGTEEKEGLKAPLWERISQGMLELGYERSAKRCKEKWENINKYFRKTKDASKKRSFDSRTCPYFHQLSTLYNQAKVVDEPELCHESSPALPETISTSNS